MARTRAVSCTRATTIPIGKPWSAGSALSKAEQLQPPLPPEPERQCPSFKRWRRAIMCWHTLTPTTAHRDNSRNFPALGTRSRFRGHERPRGGEKISKDKDQIGMGRNAIQSPVENRRPCCRLGNRARRRRAFCLRQHLGAGVATAFRSRRRFNPAFNYEIFRRTL